MEASNFHETSGEPRDKSRSSSIKALRDIGRLLKTSTRRDANVSHEPGTVEKASIMMLSTIMLDCGLDDAAALLDTVQLLLWDVLTEIASAPAPLEALQSAIAYLDPTHNDHALSVHRTTVSSMIPHANRSQLDEHLMEQYQDCVMNLDALGLKSGALILAADETHEKVRSIYYNGNYSYIVVGQSSTWQRGFIYPTEYDATHQLFMGSRHRDYRLIDSDKKGVRPWIQDVSRKCRKARDLGIKQVLIEGDRTYFNAELFAMATLGLIDPGTSPARRPRVIVPRKFTREKEDFKWNFLLDKKKPQVFTDYIALNPYKNPALKKICESSFKSSYNHQIMIPYTCVATVDEYNAREKRTLEQTRARARFIQLGINKETRDMERLVNSYLHAANGMGDRYIKEPSFGRGARRRKFANDNERKAYDACFKCYARLEKRKAEKAALLKTLMFFAISIVPGDKPAKKPPMFIAFAHDYHERWGIENGIRDVKERFLSKGRSRQPCIRQFRMMLGMMLYNRWEVERRRIFQSKSIKKRQIRDRKNKSRPWIRRKHEQEYHHLPTAVGFLLKIWREGILSVLKC